MKTLAKPKIKVRPHSHWCPQECYDGCHDGHGWSGCLNPRCKGAKKAVEQTTKRCSMHQLW